MIRVASATPFIVLITLISPGTTHAAVPTDRRQIGAVIDDDHADLTGVFSKPPSHSAAQAISKARRFVQTLVPACQGNLPQSRRNLGTLCAQAAGLCASTADPDDVGYWVYTAPAGPPDPGPADWTSTGQVVCRGADEPEDAIVPVVTAADFRRLPLPAAGLKVQPPTRQTLVNIPTNLYADSRAAILPTQILGFAVRVRATPLRFRWNYGDGTDLRTDNAGGPYPQLDTAHTYRQPGTRTVRLSTTYEGEYSVSGGPWLPIDGVAIVESQPTTLTVRSAKNHLVAEPLS
jgi:hypothetical protein